MTLDFRILDQHRSPRDLLDPDTYDPACSDHSIEGAYLNDPTTKAALHIQDGIQDWTSCTWVPYLHLQSS